MSVKRDLRAGQGGGTPPIWGLAAKALWVSSGEVVTSSSLAQHWGVSASTVRASARRGQASFVNILARYYYPKEFLELDREEASRVSAVLTDLPPEGVLLFWKQPHQGLEGKLPSAFLQRRRDSRALERVVNEARNWAERIKAAAAFTIQGVKKAAK